MLRTIYFVIYFVIYLIFLIPKYRKVDILEKNNQIDEMYSLLHQIASTWGKRILKASGTTVQIRGLEKIPKGPVLFVSNHQGYFDIPSLFGFIDKPKSFIAKKELFKSPLFGRWMKKHKSVVLDRENPRQSIKAIQEAIALLKSGMSIVIFPEGTRSKGPHMNEFKRGSLKIATKAKVPIVPIAINGSYKVLEQNKIKIQPTEIIITILDPIYTDQLSKEEQNILSEKVHQLIQNHLYS